MLGGALVVVAAVRLLDEAVAGAGLDPVGPGSLAEFAELLLEVVATQTGTAIDDEVVFKDDLHLGTMTMRLIAHRFHIRLHVVPVTAERLAQIDHHVDLHRAILAGQLGLVALGFRQAVAVRKADHRSDLDVRTPQPFRRLLHRIRFDAHGSDIVLRGELAAGFEVGIRHRRMQQRMIDHFGEL